MLELMKKYLMTLLTLGLACNAAACMEDEPFYAVSYTHLTLPTTSRV